MTRKEQLFKAADEILLDIRVQMHELDKAARAVGKFQLEPGEVYISPGCYEALTIGRPFTSGVGSILDQVFGLPVYQIPVEGYHVRVAPRLVMRPGVELPDEKGSGY